MKFPDMNRDGRIKMSHNPFHGPDRDTPYPEKSEDMINPERIKVVAHLPEPLFPPGKSVLFHPFPVIGWETPVLTLYGKIIRGCPCLNVHVVKFLLAPGICPEPVYPNGYIPFQDDAVAVSIFRRFF